jgi:aryl-alcohol dehydrogenase-like predicted oxidoreductase
MNYRTLGKCGVKVSEIGFGGWAIGGPSQSAGIQFGWGEVPEEDAIAAVRRAHELGVNFFDTADVYGKGRSEEILGKALAGAGDRIYVASKVGNVTVRGRLAKDFSRAHIEKSCEASLRRLGREVLDLYQLHNPGVKEIRSGDWPDTMERLREQGKIRWFGVSIFKPSEALAVLERGCGHTLQLVYNALRQEMAEEVLPLAGQKNFGVIARVPLYYGLLAGKFTAETRFPINDHRSHTLPPEKMQELAPRAAGFARLAAEGGESSAARWSLRFALSYPAVSTTIPGARNATQAEQNALASDGTSLSAEQVEAARRLWAEDDYLRDLRSGP